VLCDVSAIRCDPLPLAGPVRKGGEDVNVCCPFCKDSVTVFLWSLYGGGKRCQCGALFDRGGNAHHWASRFPDEAPKKEVTS